MSEDDKNEPPYRTGYGKPPKNWQFKPGQSGNPVGRPRKQARSDVIDVAAVLDKPVRVRKNGKVARMDPREIILRQQVKKALGGDLKALGHVLDQFAEYGLLGEPATASSAGGVLVVPSGSMPFAMACIMVERFGVKKAYSEAELTAGRAAYLATRDEKQARVDDAIGYVDLPARAER